MGEVTYDHDEATYVGILVVGRRILEKRRIGNFGGEEGIEDD